MYVILNYILPFFGLMGLLVAIHEGGHYLAARLLRIHVTDFAIGMGPTLWSRTDKRGCVWRLCALPIGGYVKMLGDANAASAPGEDKTIAALTPEQKAGVFQLRPPGHRAFVIAAGPLANFLLGFLILWGVYALHGHAQTPPVAGDVIGGLPAAEAGLLPGDRIVTIDGIPVKRFEEIIRLIGERADRATVLTVERGAERFVVTLIPRPSVSEGLGGEIRVGRIGIMSGASVMERLGVVEAASQSVDVIVTVTTTTLKALWEMVTFDRSLRDMGGPVKIAEVSGDALVKFGLVPFIVLAAIISVNLGIMNLMPIPVLDGGHLVIYGIEALRGRPASPRAIAYMYKGGALALLFLFAAITGFDIGALISRLLSA